VPCVGLDMGRRSRSAAVSAKKAVGNVFSNCPRHADGRSWLGLAILAPIPWRVSAAERELLGSEVSEALFARAAEAALSNAEPLRQNGYKGPLAKALICRVMTSLASVRKAGRAARSFGPATEIVACLVAKAFWYLEGPVRRVTGFDTVVPSLGYEQASLPNPQRIVHAARQTLNA
jgi:CO dehydrogenase flavoprotein C-terminal domain